MSYVRDNLMPKEKILFTVRVSRAVLVPSVVMFLFGLGSVILGLYSIAESNSALSSSSQVTDITLILTFLFFAALSGTSFFIAILYAIKAMIILLTTEFAVTNGRIIAKSGFIRRHTMEMFLSKVETVSVNQNIIGRLLNFGTVTVTGTGGTKESFRAIIDPVDTRKKINRVIELAMQHQRGASRR